MSSSNEDLSTLQVYARLLNRSKQYWRAFFLAIVANLVYGGVDAGFIKAMQPLVDEGLFNKNSHFLVQAPLFVIGMMLLRGIASFLSGYLMGWVGQNVVSDLRKEIYFKYLQLPASFIDANSSGSLISKLTFNADKVSASITNVVKVLVRESSFLIFMIVWMLLTSWYLTLLYLVSAPLIAIVIVTATRRFRQASRHMQSSMGDITRLAGEGISGYRTVKIFCGEKQASSLFNATVERFRNRYMKMIATHNISNPLIQFFAAVGLSVVLYFSFAEVLSGKLTSGDFVFMISAMIGILRPLKQLSSINSQLQEGLVAAKSLFDVMDETEEVNNGTINIETIHGAIEFQDVCFKFNGQNQWALKHLNLKSSPGKVVALVGSSGSGKSTLLNLLMGFYQPQSGKILIDGVPLAEISLKSLRSQIALVSQQVTLFDDTVRNNLIFGLPRDVDDTELIEVLKRSHAWEFVEKLPSQLDTFLGEDSSALSGGQRQRLAIARALLRNSPLLLLDEATSALDSESEEKVQAGLDEIMMNRTTLVVAHRLSTIRNADIIVVMDSGQVVEQGTHQQLLGLDGFYAKLYRLQYGETNG